MPPLPPGIRGASAHLRARAGQVRPLRWTCPPAIDGNFLHPEGWRLALDRLSVRVSQESLEQRVRQQVAGRIRRQVEHGPGDATALPERVKGPAKPAGGS